MSLCVAQGCENEKMNFILIDGTWSNSNAMFKRLKVTQNEVLNFRSSAQWQFLDKIVVI